MNITNKLTTFYKKAMDRYNEHKDAYKNNFILTLLWMLLVSTVAMNAMDKVVKDNDLDTLFYGQMYKRKI